MGIYDYVLNIFKIIIS